MRCHVPLAASMLVAMSLPAAAEAIAPAGATLTAAAQVTGAPLGRTAAPTRVKAAPEPSADTASQAPTTRPWLLVLTGIVLVGMMARRRL